jgi:2-dehydropantoate 2-reductase
MKLCVFGAGAIGGYLATHLAQVDGVEVSVVARGEHLAAIRRNGLAVESPRGTLRARVQATDNPPPLGAQGVVIYAHVAMLVMHDVIAAAQAHGPAH